MKVIKGVVLCIFGLIFLFAAHQITALVFKAHGWKGMEASDWASWIQAIFSVVAIGAAIWVMNWQHEKTVLLMNWEHQKSIERDVDAERSEMRNVLLAIRSELALFPDVVRQRIADPGPIWPATNLATPIYVGLAAKLGILENDFLRGMVIGAYANVWGFFRAADEYSLAARRSLDTKGENPDIESAKRQIWETVHQDGRRCLALMKDTRKALDDGIEALKKPDPDRSSNG